MSTELPKLDQVMEAAKKLPRATARLFEGAGAIVVNTAEKAFADEVVRFADEAWVPARREGEAHAAWMERCGHAVSQALLTGEPGDYSVALYTANVAVTERALRAWAAARGENLVVHCPCCDREPPRPCVVHGNDRVMRVATGHNTSEASVHVRGGAR